MTQSNIAYGLFNPTTKKWMMTDEHFAPVADDYQTDNPLLAHIYATAEEATTRGKVMLEHVYRANVDPKIQEQITLIVCKLTASHTPVSNIPLSMDVLKQGFAIWIVAEKVDARRRKANSDDWWQDYVYDVPPWFDDERFDKNFVALRTFNKKPKLFGTREEAERVIRFLTRFRIQKEWSYRLSIVYLS